MFKRLKKLWLFIRFGKIKGVIKDNINGFPCEIAFYDRNGNVIGYWAYGAYDPAGIYFGGGVESLVACYV